MLEWNDYDGRNKNRKDQLGRIMVSTLAMTDALAKLLIDKGIITDEEFKTQLTQSEPSGSEASSVNRAMQRQIIVRLIAGCAVLLACSATAQTRFPAEVERFIERRDKCDHFRGEEPYDQDRRAFIHERLLEFCVGTDKELAEIARASG